jgi:hypothetical protein
MRHWYHVARHNENIMPLCINAIHCIVLTFESYLLKAPGDHFMLGGKCIVVNAFSSIMVEGQMHLHKVSLHKLA